MKTKIEQICQDFFRQMKIDITSLTVKVEDEERNIYFVHLETTDSKLIIGTHGQSLEAIKHLLSRLLGKIIPDITEPIIIHLEVNDYLKSKDERLFRYIDSRIDYVVKSQKEIVLPEYSSYERKKIHNYLSEKNLKNVRSYSVGEGKERAMHLAPVAKAVTSDIDIDGIDI